MNSNSNRSLQRKVHRQWLKFWFRPVRVFCFHQVSDAFDPDTMWEGDWTQTDVFKSKISELKKIYTFVSLTEAFRHIADDKLRMKKYAALTADDGWASIKNILPWLAEQGIPVTLFLNPLYLDGKHFQSRSTEKFLTREEVATLVRRYKPFITIASHGWSHTSCLEMSDEEFMESVNKAEKDLAEMEGKLPFYAFTFGHSRYSQIRYLQSKSLVPVLVADEMNYHSTCVFRECIDVGFVA